MIFSRMRCATRIPLLLVSISWAQDQAGNVNLFQTYFQDAMINQTINGEGFFQYGTYGNAGSTIDLAVQAGFPVAPLIQISGGMAFENYSRDGADGESGITDILLSGRYQVVQGNTPIGVGAQFTLPVGSETLGQGNFDFGFFGSLRHDLNNSPLLLTGTFGLNFVEKRGSFNTATNQFETDRGTSILLAAGVIYPMPSGLSLLFEMSLQPDEDYSLLSGGLNYALRGGGSVRGALGLGLDDGAPDFAFRLGYARGF